MGPIHIFGSVEPIIDNKHPKMSFPCFERKEEPNQERDLGPSMTWAEETCNERGIRASRNHDLLGVELPRQCEVSSSVQASGLAACVAK